MTGDQIQEVIATEVANAVRWSIPEMFGSIKTIVIELFDDWYVVLSKASAATTTTVVAVVGIRGERSLWYLDFNYTKPSEFDEAKDLIVEVRSLSNVEGCFYWISV